MEAGRLTFVRPHFLRVQLLHGDSPRVYGEVIRDVCAPGLGLGSEQAVLEF
jgi:hypothetical protein